jgi:copper chaperone CopZ
MAARIIDPPGIGLINFLPGSTAHCRKGDCSVETISISIPTMYGDHHVVEVRRILLAIPGVSEVYASSAFQFAEVEFDPAVVGVEDINRVLEAAGYLGELEVPVETGAQATLLEGESIFMRHTEAYAQTRDTVSFAQQVPFSGRPLWPCPGMGILKNGEKEPSNA